METRYRSTDLDSPTQGRWERECDSADRARLDRMPLDRSGYCCRIGMERAGWGSSMAYPGEGPRNLRYAQPGWAPGISGHCWRYFGVCLDKSRNKTAYPSR